jgi:transmembrane sensor
MLRREAATWLARLQSRREPDVETKFRKWRDADPRHAAAFDGVQRTYERAGLLRQSQVVSSVPPEPAWRFEWKPRPAWAAAAAAAAAAAVLVPVTALVVRGGAPFGGPDTMMLMTAVGEIRRVNLPDGSSVTLDTSTKIDVEISRSLRTAHLRHGRARFRVAQANTPFVVETAGATITTRQGVIDVEQGGEKGRVQLLAGAAVVRGLDQGQAPSVTLGAGETVTMSPTDADQKSLTPPGPDWTRGMLQFDRTPLADAVALANRYSDRHIVLVGDLGVLKVTGAFRAGDTMGLAKALAAAFGLSLQQREDGNLVLSRTASRGLQNKRGG